MKKIIAFLRKLFVKKIEKPAPLPMNEQLVTYLEAAWTQKQLDDLLLVNQSVMESLRKQPFNEKYLDQRDRIHHDINILQPVVVLTGQACACEIEKKFNIEFRFLMNRNKQVKRAEQPKSSNIILPGR